MTFLFFDPAIAMAAVLLVTVAGVGLTTVEDLRGREVFQPRGVLSWTVLRTMRHPWRTPRVARLLDVLFTTDTFVVALKLRLVVLALLAAALVLGAPDAACGVLVFFVLVLTLLHNARSIFGLDGAHHMNVVILTAGTLFFVNSPGSVGRASCLGYIAVHALGAYFVSGLAKLLDRSWRRGEALPGVLSTKIYGHPWLGRVLRRQPLASVLGCWLVIGLESAFPLLLFADEPVLAAGLIVGAAFHAGTAVFMGLNNFLFAFVATYPAIAFLHAFVRNALIG